MIDELQNFIGEGEVYKWNFARKYFKNHQDEVFTTSNWYYVLSNFDPVQNVKFDQIPEEKLLELLEGTLISARSNYQSFQNFQIAGVDEFISSSAGGARDCQKCAEWNGESIELTIENFPPHHPGCRCVANMNTNSFT